MPPSHLLKARDFVTEQAYKIDDVKCFEFVNWVLKSTLPESALIELSELHNTILLSLEPAHRYHEIIPYHYYLISLFLQKHPNWFKHWKFHNLFEAKPGDIFVYVAPDYEPDPSRRTPGQPSGTHIAFIDEIVDSQVNEFITVRVIDSSERKKGRGYSQDYVKKKNHSSIAQEGIAYSTITLRRNGSNKQGDKIIWTCEILGQRKSLKYVSILSLR